MCSRRAGTNSYFFSFLFTAGTVFKELQWPCALACLWLHYLSPSGCYVSAGPTSAQDWHLSATPLFVAPWFTPIALTSSHITGLGWLSRVNTCVWNCKSHTKSLHCKLFELSVLCNAFLPPSLLSSPIFEEDTPSVMEIEMEELDKWMNSMNKNGTR